jgi:hypothetical protein
MTATRAIIDIALFVGIFILPWWAIFPVAIICLFLFNDFYEIFAIGFIFDNLYGVTTLFWFPFTFVYISLSAILFLTVNFLKRRLKFYF